MEKIYSVDVYTAFQRRLASQRVIRYNDHGFLPCPQSTRLGGRVL